MPALNGDAFSHMKFKFLEWNNEVYLESLILAQIERWRHA
jgi:hypothetical protein